jgi:oligoribonuclease NrnB/cAMP/cGMP phosphodiesterase (DHH superfamily)
MTENEDDNLKLTPEQELIVRDAFQDGATPNLSELTQKVFKNPSIDGRSKEGRAIKEYISEFQIGKVRVNVIKKMEPYALSGEQKEKIKEEYKKDGFTTLLFTRNLLNDQSIRALHLEP